MGIFIWLKMFLRESLRKRENNFFSPETVERLQSFIFQDTQPKKMIQTPVFEFAA